MRKAFPLLLCLGLLLSAAGCAAETEEPLLDPTVTVETTAAQTGSLSTQSTYIGTVSAEGTASVVAMVSGTVEEVAVSTGDTVAAGALLCRIDDESARLALENARAGYQSALTSVASAQAAVNSAQETYQSTLAGYGGAGDGTLTVLEEQVRLAEDNFADTQALFDIGAASQAEVDQAHQAVLSAQAGLEAAQAGLSAAQAGVRQAETAVQTAQAGVESARVGISSAEYQLTLYNLTAPIAGVVEAVHVTEHNLASSGQVAFVISNGSNKTVTFYVTDDVHRNLTPGQPVTVTVDGMNYAGAVTEISGVVDASVGLFQVKAIIEGAQNLPDGLAVTLTTDAYRIDGAVLIPSDALFFENGEAYTFVVENGTAVRTDVELGLYTSDTIAVTAGLNPGDQVITTWSASLRDGAPVRLADAGETPAGETEAEAAE